MKTIFNIQTLVFFCYTELLMLLCTFTYLLLLHIYRFAIEKS